MRFPSRRTKRAIGTGLASRSDAFLDGVRIETPDDDLRNRSGIDDSQRRGAIVVDVDPESAAADAGLSKGDLIVEVAHQPLKSSQEAVRVLNRVRDSSGVLLLRVVGRQGTRFIAVELETDQQG